MTSLHALARRGGFAGAAVLLLILLSATYLGYFSSNPYTALPATHRSSPIKIVFLSGDMGFNVGMGPRIAHEFSSRGYPVLAFNSLSWFRTRRSVEEVRRLIPALLDRADDEFGSGPTIIVGQSFGADAVQLGLADLDRSDRKRIAGLAMIVPTDSIFLRASPAEMLNFSPPDLVAHDSARKLTWLPVLCLHGVKETASLCPLLASKNVTSIALAGGHYLDEDAQTVARSVLAWVDGLSQESETR